MEDFDDDGFSDEEHKFSSFTYRIAAARNLGRMMRMPPPMFPDDPTVDRVQSLLTNWRMHLPDSKRDDLKKDCTLDEMMFQAHFITYAYVLTSSSSTPKQKNQKPKKRKKKRKTNRE